MLPGIQGIHPVIGASAASVPGSGNALFAGGALAHYSAFALVTTYYPLAAEEYDTATIHDIVTNNERMTVPSGGSLVRLLGQETGASLPVPVIFKNGASFLGGATAVTQEQGVNIKTGPLVVSPGDYFTLEKGPVVTPDTNGGVWLGIENLDPATKYALVSKTGNQALTGGAATALTWETETADTNSFHDNVTNNTRLTVPSGVGRVKLVCNLQSTSNVNTPYLAQIKKNGAVAAGCPVFGSTFTGRMSLASAILNVTPGDYFEVEALTTNAQTVGNNNHTWFAIYEIPDYVRTLVKKVATQAVSSGVPVAIAFGLGSEVYDTGNAHDEVTNNERLTVPVGYTKAKLSYSLVTANAAGVAQAVVRKNGSLTLQSGLPGHYVNMTGVDYLSGEGAWIDVTAGDYFELIFTPGANQTLPIDDRTWLAIELA